MKDVIMIVGPTASGKTDLAIALAKEIDGEIISADSMQIYRFMDIGTAKPSLAERAGIPHYLIDTVNPDEAFSVARFKEEALHYIEEILTKKKVPIVVGGTGLYIDALVHNITFSETPTDWDFREKLQAEALKKGNQSLLTQLAAIDPQMAQRLHVNDVKRVIRALEVFHTTGKTMTQLQALSRQHPPQYHFSLFGLRLMRETLYRRIDQRVDQMLQLGLLEEVERLVALGYGEQRIPMQALGYKEILWYLQRKMNLEEATQGLKQNTRQFAKRQMTWFRHLSQILWLDAEGLETWEILKNLKVVLETGRNF